MIDGIWMVRLGRRKRMLWAGKHLSGWMRTSPVLAEVDMCWPRLFPWNCMIMIVPYWTSINYVLKFPLVGEVSYTNKCSILESFKIGRINLTYEMIRISNKYFCLERCLINKITWILPSLRVILMVLEFFDILDLKVLFFGKISINKIIRILLFSEWFLSSWGS